MNAITCKTCSHWKKRAIDPSNLGAEERGDCREGPPTVTAILTKMGMSLLSSYPSLPADFLACDRHEPIGAFDGDGDQDDELLQFRRGNEEAGRF